MSFLEKTIPGPDQLNAEGQVTDIRVLNRDRFKIGPASVMYNGMEGAFAPVHTVVVRALGGGDVALGLITATAYGSSLMLGLGPWLLRRFKSNAKSMIWALSGGVLFGVLIALALFFGAAYPSLATWVLGIYLLFVFGLSGCSQVQLAVETSWIGDLVPLERRGWFTSAKWIVGAVGMLLFMILFGQISARSPSLNTYAGLFLLIAGAHVLAAFLMGRVTDRPPQTAKLVAAGHPEERMNYWNSALWRYIWFYVCWAAGRTALFAFTTAYMIDYLNYAMDKILLVLGITYLINVLMLFFVGRLSDQTGSRKPLLVVCIFSSLAMLLWVSSAWWGVWPIIVYQILNGAAGTTHMMLATNYGLEVLPAKGRGAYVSFARLFIGLGGAVGSIVGGVILSRLKGWSLILWSAELNHYHIYFVGCALVTAGCILPLLLKSSRGAERRL